MSRFWQTEIRTDVKVSYEIHKCLTSHIFRAKDNVNQAYNQQTANIKNRKHMCFGYWNYPSSGCSNTKRRIQCFYISDVEGQICHMSSAKYTQWRIKERIFSNNCNFFIFNIKIMLTPKRPVINAVLITYIDYSITENYIGKMASFLPYTRTEPLLKVPHHIY